MKTKISDLSMIVALLMSIAFVGCSDDNEDDENEKVSSNKHIVREIVENESVRTKEYLYDSQGRVAEMKETRGEKITTTSFTYGDNTIIGKITGDWNDGEVHTYILSGGLISKESYQNYVWYHINSTYDSEGHLSSQLLSGQENATFNLTWFDGNLTGGSRKWVSGDQNDTLTITYSNIPWPKNLFFDWEVYEINSVFEPLGFYGKMPKFLPSKIELTNKWYNNLYYQYEYRVENGVIAQIVCNYKEPYDHGTKTRVLEWE